MANSLLDFYGQQPGGEAQPRTSTATRPRSLLDAYQPTPQDVARAKAVPQAPAPSAPNQDAGLWSDTANLAKMGIGQLGQGAGYLTGIESLEQAGAGLAERSMQALSPAQQQAMQNEFVTHSDEEGYGVGPALTETPLRSLYGALVSSLPATAAGMGVGGLAAKGLGAAGSALATRGVAGSATLARPAVSGAVGFGAGEGLVSAGIAGSDVQDFVRNADQELLDQAPGYQELIAQGMDPDTAREALAEELAANAALGSGAVVGLLGAPMGAVFGRWMGGAGPKTIRGAVLGGAAGEAGQEAAQSAAEEYVGGTQRAQIDPTQAPTLASMANQAVGGALAGGVMGGGFGALQGRAQQKRDALLEQARGAARQAQQERAAQAERDALRRAERVPGLAGLRERQARAEAPPVSVTDPRRFVRPIAPETPLQPGDAVMSGTDIFEVVNDADTAVTLRAESGEEFIINRADLAEGYQRLDADAWLEATNRTRGVRALPSPGTDTVEVEFTDRRDPRLLTGPTADRPGVTVGEAERPPTREPRRPADPAERRFLTLENRARTLEAKGKTLPEGQQETLDGLRDTLLNRPVRDERVRSLLDRYGEPSAAGGEPPPSGPAAEDSRQPQAGSGESFAGPTLRTETADQATPEPAPVSPAPEADTGAPVPAPETPEPAVATTPPEARPPQVSANEDVDSVARGKTADWAMRYEDFENGALPSPEMYDGLESMAGGTIKVQRNEDGTYDVFHAFSGVDQPHAKARDADMARNAAERLYGYILGNQRTDLLRQHRKVVEAAARSGEAIPDEVLADYPDLRRIATSKAKPVAAASTGKRTRATTPRGTEVEADLALVDAGSLITSNDSAGNANPAYPASLQPRDRQRATSQTQINRIARGIRPELLGDTGTATGGAPIVGPDGVVESGNGRTLALQQAYREGGAEGYKQWLKDNAQQFGLTPEQVDGMSAPVLVRRRATEMTDAERAQFAREANQSDVQAMSPAEIARADAERITPDMLKSFAPSEDGNVLAASNRSFVQAFAGALGETEAAGLRDADGNWTRQMRDRLQSAIFAKAYGSDELLALQAEDADPDNRNIVNGLVAAAGEFARARAIDPTLANGDLDIVAPLVDAVRLIRSTPPGQLAERLGQSDMFSGDTDPDVATLARFINQNKRSAKRLGEAFRAMAQYTSNELNTTGRLLGERAGRGEIIESATRRTSGQQTLDEGAQGGRDSGKQDQGQRTEAADAKAAEPAGKQAEEVAAKSGDLAEQLAGMSDDELSSLIDDVAADNPPAQTEKPRPQRRPKATTREGKAKRRPLSTKAERADTDSPADVDRTAGEIAKSMGVNLSSAGDNALKGLVELFGGKGKLNSGLSFDEDTYARAKPHFQAMLRDFQAAGKDVRDFIRAVLDNFGTGVKPYILRFAQDLRNAQRTDERVEPDSQGSAADRPEDEAADESGRGPDGRTPGRRGAASQGEGDTGAGDPGVSDAAAAGAREPGDSDVVVQPDFKAAGAGSGAAGDQQRGGSAADRDQRVQPEPKPDETPEDAAGRQARDLKARIAQQREAESLPTRIADLDNIRETLPVLLPPQQEDVQFAERRLLAEDKAGVLFTNGTGTGKTFTGLGVIKRLTRQGKDNIIIVVPGDSVAGAWIESAKALNLDIKSLRDTQDNGGKGVVVTTYANFYQNNSLMDLDWDLAVFDESHKLSSNKDGSMTDAVQMMWALTNHPRGARKRAEHAHRDAIDAMERKISSIADNLIKEGATERQARFMARNQLEREISELDRKVMDTADEFGKQPRGKALFLSATPFAYVESTEYAEGYLYDYPSENQNTKGGWSHIDPRSEFFIQHFGYRWRYGKLTKPDAQVDQGLMQRNFNQWLKNQGALRGRMLEVDADYSRQFVLVEDAIGMKIDEGIEYLRDTKGKNKDGNEVYLYDALYTELRERFGYLERIKLLEAIKAKHAVERAKKHMALGRKVVVFHNYNVGGAEHPFRFDTEGSGEIAVAARRLKKDRPDLWNLDLSELRSPIATFKAAFGDQALFINGTVPKQKRRNAIRQFSSDDPRYNLIVVQIDAGKEGVSLHDTTGKFQRVELNLGLPIKPTDSIQAEGRIYRTGQVSNAVFEYFNTGTNYERYAFATAIAQRAGAAENLALGTDARDLMNAFVEAFSDPTSDEPSLNQGTGGKTRDRTRSELTLFQQAVAYYFGRQKKGGRRDSREGVDYFATPEPLGLKMVEWANARPGDRLLEPSAGHGAIARWFPEDTTNTFIEPAHALASQVSLVARHGKVETGTFENHHKVNKYDAIVMNPPFGSGGKTAIEHLDKAVTHHLRDGGRVVALIPTGPDADKRFDAWYGKAEGVYLIADIALPRVTFERAGTTVSSRIVVLDKVADADTAQGLKAIGREIDAESINDLFERIENMDIPARVPPQTAGQSTQQAQPPDAATGQKNTLADFGIQIKPAKTPKGKAVWEATGNTYAHRDAIKALGGRWYGPKKAWTFYEGDPSDALLEKLKAEPDTDTRYSRAEPARNTDAEYLAAVERGDMEAAQRMVDEALAKAGAYWHGTPSGDLRGGTSGLHVGTKRAAAEALEARIGIPADGKGWDGTRKYGETLLAGRGRVASGEFGKYRDTGYNADSPRKDFYARDHKIPTVGDGVNVDPDWKPWVRPVLIVGDMTNTPRSTMSDTRANATMRGMLRKGTAKRGYFYTNEGEDTGSVSAVLPNGDAVRVKLPDPVTRDDNGEVIPLSKRFNPRSDDIRFARGQQSRNTVAAVRTELNLNPRAERALLDSGLVTIVQSASEIPGNHPSDVAGAYHQGKVYLVADNIPAGRAEGLILHEIGIHAGLKGMVGDAQYAQIVQTLKRQVRAGSRPNATRAAREAFQAHLRASADSSIRGNDAALWEETIAYLSEMGSNAPVIRRLLAAVRAFLRRLGLVRQFTAADMAHLARGSVQRLVEGMESGGQNVPRQAFNPETIRTIRDELRADDESLVLREIPSSKVTVRNGVEYRDPPRDQDVLDRVALLKRNEEALDAIQAAQETQYSRAPQTDTPEFRNWFKDSVVTVDGKPGGEPLVVYHGAKGEDFSVFDKGKSGQSTKAKDSAIGFFFTDSPEVASGYTGFWAGDKMPEGARVVPAYLSAERPYMVDMKGERYSKEVFEDVMYRVRKSPEQIVKKAFASKGFWVKAPGAEPSARDKRIYREPSQDQVDAILKSLGGAAAKGYDSVLFKNVYDPASSHPSIEDELGGVSNVWAVFRPEQIKSAIGNVGTFDPNNPDIRYSRAPADLTPRATLGVSLLARNRGDATAAKREARALYPGMAADISDWIDTNGDRWQEAAEGQVGALYSRAGPVNAQQQAARDAVSTLGKRVQELPKATAQALKDASANVRPALMNLMTRQMLVEGSKDVSEAFHNAAREFERVARAMDRRATSMIQHVYPLAQDWAKLNSRWWWNKTNRTEALNLSRLMHAATLAGVDPSKPLPSWATEDAAAAHAELKQQFDGLSDRAKTIYRKARDAYTDQRNDLFKALMRRMANVDPRAKLPDEMDAFVAAIEQRMQSDEFKPRRAALAMLRQAYESGRKGVYFPLFRTGDYYLYATDPDGNPRFSLFKSQREQRLAMQDLIAQGYDRTQISAGKQIKNLSTDTGPGQVFMASLLSKVEAAGLDEDTAQALKDEMWQSYLHTLPDVSIRKAFIHRKGTAGFSDDALQAFATRMSHGAKQIARLEASHTLSDLIVGMKKQARELADSVQGDAERAVVANRAKDYAAGLDSSLQWMMNPTTARWASRLTSTGFVYFLGLTPGAALVNSTQIAVVTYPALGARFGATKAAAAIGAAYKEYGKLTGWRTQSWWTKKDSAKRKAFDRTEVGRMLLELEESGIIDRTQTASLIGMEDTAGAEFRLGGQGALQAVGFMYHEAERLNREVTAIAAYRLARGRGDSHAKATEFAYDMTQHTQFSYENSNRSAWMRGNAMRVVTLFMQYSTNIAWRMARDAMVWANRHKTAEERRVARNELAGIMGATAFFAGAMGLPFVATMTWLLQAAHDLSDDEDDPEWSAELAIRQTLRDLGAGSSIFEKGVINTLTPFDLAGRTSLSYLFFRPADRDMDVQQTVSYYLEQAAGPVFGIAANAARGVDLMTQGQTLRGFEMMIPKFARDGIRSARYGMEGATSLRGDPIKDEFSPAELIGQFIGLSPAELIERYEQRSAIKTLEQRVLNRRRSLMNGYYLAWKNGDRELLGDTLKRIRAFNRAHPQIPISGSTIRQSMRARIRYSREAIDGLSYNKSLRTWLLDQSYLEN